MEKTNSQTQTPATVFADEGGRYLRFAFKGKALERKTDFVPPPLPAMVVEADFSPVEIKDFGLRIGSKVTIVDKPGPCDFRREGIPAEEETTSAIITKITQNGPERYTVRALG